MESRLVSLDQESITAIVDQLFIKLMATKKERQARKPRKAKAEAYTEGFEQCWKAYPSRPGNNKREAFKCYSKRIEEGRAEQYLLDRTLYYAAHCDSEGKTGTNFVLQASTFYGCSCRFDDSWPIAEKKKVDEPWAKMPYENNDLVDWAKLHGYSNPSAGQSYPDYRRKLQIEVEQRLSKT